jgi:CopA family copper-resistance protein
VLHPGGLSRRRFVQGLALGGVAAGAGLWRAPAFATGEPGILDGTDFDLAIGELPVNFTGRPRTATVVNGSLPAPTLRWREGDTVRIRVANRLREPTSIHWHGIILPAAMDGVPGLSFRGIGPGETFEYRFRLRQAGTYWYHSHSGTQEQTGLYGPLVVLPREPGQLGADRDHVVVLSDWTDEDPRAVIANLKKQGDYYNLHQRTVGDFIRDALRDGIGPALGDRRAWGAMRMNPTDLADVSAATYTYLVNGVTPAGNWTALYRRGERVRLRFVNAAAMTFFDVRIPGLKLTVVAADGQDVHPVTVDEFRVAPAETYDVIVSPPGEEPWTIFAQSADRTGYARATLAPAPGLEAPVPAPDARVRLTMADMGHAGHGGHAAHDAPSAVGDGSHAEHGGGTAAAPAAGHEGHAGAGASPIGPGAITHAREEFSPYVDMRAEAPSARLDDPGVGLRGNGRRVLTYADLASAFPDPDGREPGRNIELHLTGHMERYTWSFNGVRFADAAPLRLDYGERVRIVLVNDTMMEHPIHLHGMWSDLEGESGAWQLRKHTLSVKPGQMLGYRVTADALGRWAYHCHLMLHMELGMFREVRVDVEGRHD